MHAATGGSAGASLTGVGNALTITPAAKDYGKVLQGTRSPTTTFTVTNVSTITVSPSVASLAGTQFTATSDSCTGVSLRRRGYLHRRCCLHPERLGIDWRDPVRQHGRGHHHRSTCMEPCRSSRSCPGPRTTARCRSDLSSQATFTITNVTAAPSLPLVASAVSGTGFGITSDSCNGTTLAAGASCTVVVTFTPTISGATYAGELEVMLAWIGTINQATLVGKGG